MCRNSTGFARDSLSASTRFGESWVAKELEFIAVLFYLQNSITTRACCPEHILSRQFMSAAGFPVVAADEIFFQRYV